MVDLRKILFGCLFSLCITSALWAQIDISSKEVTLCLDESNGTIEKVIASGKSIPVKKGKALVNIRDIKKGDVFYPLYGKIRKEEGEYILEGGISELEIKGKVIIEPREKFLGFDIVLDNQSSKDRGLIISLTIQTEAENVIWQGLLNEDEKPNAGKIYGNNRVPIDALTSVNQEWGIASAIPPDHPVLYDTHFCDGEFGLLYYIGIVSETDKFPNKASVSGIFYAVNPKWGFRDALSKYYAFYPEFYDVKVDKVGMWVFRMDPTRTPHPEDLAFYEAGSEEWDEVIPFKSSKLFQNDKGYGWCNVTTIKDWAKKNGIDLATRFGMKVFPYVIIGQRQIFLLPGSSLITDYDEAMELFENWDIHPNIRFQNPINANSFRSVKELKEIIHNCGLYDKDNKYLMRPRLYTGNTLTFPLNPSPYLYNDTDKMTISKYTLEYYMAEFLKELPEIAGFYLDSMGNWPKYINYRREHFKYAQNPLTLDKGGNPVIFNMISHYEFLKVLRDKLHMNGRFIFANGLHHGGARSRNGKSDYDAEYRQTSRFFLGALSDVGGSESGVGTPQWRLDLQRVIMGPKPYASLSKLNEGLGNQDLLKYFKRFAAMGMFPGLGAPFYETDKFHPAMDKFHYQYLPILQRMHNAGWKPVRGIKGTENLISERFGEPDNGDVFITLYNPGDKAMNITISIDSRVLPISSNQVQDLLEPNDEIVIKDNNISISMEPEQLRVLELK